MNLPQPTRYAYAPAPRKGDLQLEPGKPDPWCPEYGCDAYGTVSFSTLGGGPWYCRKHFPPWKKSGEKIAVY